MAFLLQQSQSQEQQPQQPPQLKQSQQQQQQHEMFDKYEIRKKFTNERNRTSFVDDEVADHIVKKSEEPITP